MAKRTKNGVVDPLEGRRQGTLRTRHPWETTITLGQMKNKGLKDNATTAKELAEINRQYREKEYAIASAGGPHSTGERHYPKSFFLTPKKEEDSDG